MKRLLPKVKLTYTDDGHVYMINGRRAKGVTSVAKIVPDSFAIEQWDRRMVLIGAVLDETLRENVAMDLEDKEAVNKYVAEAKRIARQHEKADRGTQAHRVLELILTGREDKLLTPQQKSDAEVLKRTLDAYKLTPHDGLVEQFVVWPDHAIAGRFDCICERNDGSLIVTDLKTGLNAVRYPQSTSVQLALYARAPMVSEKIVARTKGKVSIDDWKELPERLDRTRAYVLLVEQDAKVGTFHRIDIEHGWAGATYALDIVNWRKKLSYGDNIAVEVPPEKATEIITDESVAQGFLTMARRATNINECKLLWRNAKDQGCLTRDLKDALTSRAEELKSYA